MHLTLRSVFTNCLNMFVLYISYHHAHRPHPPQTTAVWEGGYLSSKRQSMRVGPHGIKQA